MNSSRGLGTVRPEPPAPPKQRTGLVLVLLVICLAVLGAIPGTTPLAWAIGAGLGFYILGHVGLWLAANSLLSRRPELADRFLVLLYRTTPGPGKYRSYVSRLAACSLDGPKCDSLWREVEPKFGELPAGLPLMLATNYIASLTARGLYREGIEILSNPALDLPPELEQKKHFRLFSALRWNNLGACHLGLGQFSEAGSVLERGLSLQVTGPVKDHLVCNQARLYFQTGEAERAKTCLDQIGTGQQLVQLMRALLLAEGGWLEEARSLLPAEAPQNKPCLRLWHLTHAVIAPEEARMHLQSAAQQPGALGQVAELAARLLPVNEAETFAEQARERDPQSYWTARARQILQERRAELAPVCENAGVLC